MKRVLTKAQYEALTDAATKALYKATGETFTLELEDYEDAGEMRRARDREKEEKAEAKRKQAEAEAALQALKDSTHRNSGDVVALEASWKTKLDKAVADGASAVAKLQASIKKALIDGTAGKLATELAGDAAQVLLPHLTQRFSVEFPADGEPVLRVLDKDSKPSAFGLEDLRKEFLDNKAFASVLVGSRASGGAGSGSPSARTGVSGAPAPADKKPQDWTEAERRELAGRDPVAFAKMFNITPEMQKHIPSLQGQHF